MEQGHVSKPRSKGGSYLERGAYWKEGVRFITVFQCDVTEIIIMCVATNRGYEADSRYYCLIIGKFVMFAIIFQSITRRNQVTKPAVFILNLNLKGTGN